MLERLGLRLRIFLFFGLLGLGGVAIAAGGLYAGYARTGLAEALGGFVFAGLVISFLWLGLVVAVWLLFDENVARPIDRLAAGMRARAHAGVDKNISPSDARYLGDLAPAVAALAGQLTQSTQDATAAVARATQQLEADRARLSALLTEVPVAMIMVSPSHRIVLYDAQAADVLAQIGHPRLNASLFDYFDRDALLAAHGRLAKSGKDVSADVAGSDGKQTYSVRLSPISGAPGYMLTIDDAEATIAPEAARPLVFDFGLLENAGDKDLAETPLSDMAFVVFDTETTGLLPHKDEVVQIGAVRVLGCRIIEGEVIDTLVDPGMPIPPASTKVHKVTNDMVRGAPDIATAGQAFHRFCSDAVIVAHNAPFDMAFMRRHAESMGVSWDHPILDTVLLSAVVFGTNETHTLDALCERLDVTIPEHLRHTALGDAQATAEVLCKLLPMLQARGMTTFGDVIEQTRRHGRLLEDLN